MVRAEPRQHFFCTQKLRKNLKTQWGFQPPLFRQCSQWERGMTKLRSRAEWVGLETLKRNGVVSPVVIKRCTARRVSHASLCIQRTCRTV